MDADTSTRMQRFLRAAVAVLLTANAFALVLLATDEAGPLPAEQGTRTVTLIQGADGRTVEVDPNTPEGRAAIEEAKRSGATVTETTVPTNTTLPAEPTEEEQSTSTTVKGLLPTKPTLPDPKETVDDAQDLLNDTIDDAQDKVEDLVGETPLDDAVDDVQDTVNDTVDEVQDTVTTLPLVGTTTTTKAPSTTTTAPSPVEDVVEDVTDTVGGLTGGGGLGL